MSTPWGQGLSGPRVSGRRVNHTGNNNATILEPVSFTIRYASLPLTTIIRIRPLELGPGGFRTQSHPSGCFTLLNASWDPKAGSPQKDQQTPELSLTMPRPRTLSHWMLSNRRMSLSSKMWSASKDKLCMYRYWTSARKAPALHHRCVRAELQRCLRRRILHP